MGDSRIAQDGVANGKPAARPGFCLDKPADALQYPDTGQGSMGGEGGECSAGACPPLGSGWGVAESAAPIRCAKPFVLFHTLVCRP